MKQFRTKRGAGIIVLLLFAVFALCTLLVLLLGADSYRTLVARDAESARRRTGIQYIAEKVRQNDNLDAVWTEDFSAAAPLPCICLRQGIGTEDYITRIYCYDGYLRELFCDAALEMDPEAGQEILPAQALRAELDGGLLRAELTDETGETAQLTLALRSGKEAAP